MLALGRDRWAVTQKRLIIRLYYSRVNYFALCNFFTLLFLLDKHIPGCHHHKWNVFVRQVPLPLRGYHLVCAADFVSGSTVALATPLRIALRLNARRHTYASQQMASRCDDGTVIGDFLDELPNFHIDTFSELEEHSGRFAEKKKVVFYVGISSVSMK